MKTDPTVPWSALLLALLLGFGAEAGAQGALARIIYEDAETAYAAKDYSKTIEKLDEAEQRFGKINAPILHLRILARDQLLQAAGKGFDYSQVERLRDECRQFFELYADVEQAIDQLREVYGVSERLKIYPASREAHLAAIAAAQAAEEQRRADVLARLQFVDIPGGSFRMGDLRGTGDDDEDPVHTVQVRPFRLMKHEVTFAQYDEFARATGRGQPADEGWGRDRRPVINVSWDDAQAFAKWMSARTGAKLRLPSEAEWEYAARAGSETEFPWGDEFLATHANWNSDVGRTLPVGSLAPNAWGLHDMIGNVWEWVSDCWNPSYRGAPVDGSAWTSGDCANRVARGWSHGVLVRSGILFDSQLLPRVSYRNFKKRTAYSSHRGLRLAQDTWAR